MPVVLSIQSAVVAGAVGHGASSFALQCRGAEVWPLPTVLLSNHTGHPVVRGRRHDAAELAALVDGMDGNGLLGRIDAVLTGYLGTAEVAAALGAIVARIRAVAPGALWLCDPVLGDTGKGLYLPAEVGAFYRADLVPAADIVTPNLFELGWLTGTAPETVAEARRAADALRARGPDTVVVTSVPVAEDQLGVLGVDGTGAWLATAPRVSGGFNGTGDLAAALILADRIAGQTLAETLARTTGTLHRMVAEAASAGRTEVDIVAARALFDAPPRARITRL